MNAINESSRSEILAGTMVAFTRLFRLVVPQFIVQRNRRFINIHKL